MKEKVKALWKLCFDDSDQFIDMYFRLRYKSEINVVIESGLLLPTVFLLLRMQMKSACCMKERL